MSKSARSALRRKKRLRAEATLSVRRDGAKRGDAHQQDQVHAEGVGEVRIRG